MNPHVINTDSLVVALDPGKATGIATRRMADDEPGRLRLVSAMPFWGALNILSTLWDAGDLDALVIEDTRGQTIHARLRSKSGSPFALAKIARNIGGIDRDVTLWLDWAEAHDVPVVLFAPTSKKWKAADFEANVLNAHLHGRTNQHGRDAARLVLHVSPGDLRIARAVAELPDP